MEEKKKKCFIKIIKIIKNKFPLFFFLSSIFVTQYNKSKIDNDNRTKQMSIYECSFFFFLN